MFIQYIYIGVNMDYYQRKAKVFILVKNRLKLIIAGQKDWISVEDIIDEVIENPSLAIGERIILDRINLMVDRYGLSNSKGEIRKVNTIE